MVVVSPGFPPVRGGVEEHVGRLVEGLTQAGHRVEVLTARRGLSSPTFEQRGGVAVRTYPAWPLPSMSISPQLVLAALRRRADGGPGQLLHVHSYHAATAIAVFNRPFRGRVVFTPHYHGGGHTAAARLLHRGYRLLSRCLFAAATGVICVSRAERDQLLADVPEVPQGRVRVIPNGVATEALRSAEPLTDQPPTVLSVGRLEPYKGVERVIEAFADVAGAARLVIIGSGSQLAELQAQIERLGLVDRVRLLGGVDEATLHRWLRTARVLVSLSAHEAFGMAPLEAAAAGCRVVLSDIAAHREIAQDYLADAAVLVDPDHRAAITAAIAEQLGPDDRIDSPVPSWTDVTAETIEVYRSVLDRAATSSGGAGRRIDPIDLPWAGFWSGMVAGPLQMRPLAEVRDAVEDFISTHPRHPLGCRLDAVSGRWVPVAEAERRAWVDSIIRGADSVDTEQVSAELERYRPALDSPAPLNVILAPDGIVTYLSHAVGDAATLTGVVFGLVLADPARLAALEGRAVLGDALGVLVRQQPTTYLAWLCRAVRTIRPRGEPPRPAAPTPTSTAPRPSPQPDVAVGVLTNSELRALTSWRNQHHPGVSLSAVLASRVCLGLAAAGLPMQRSGFYSLFDLRSTLPADGPAFGNLAKSLFLAADPGDPRAIDAAIRETVGTRRALPALVAGAVLSRLSRVRGRSDQDRADVADGPITMSFSSMPTLPGLTGLPWGDGARRYIGLGYPTSPDGISVFAVRFRDRMEVAVSFDKSRIDSSQALAGIAAIAV